MTDTARTVVPAKKATPVTLGIYNPQGLLVFSTCDADASGSESSAVRMINETPFPRVYLDFCAHHFAEHELGLELHGFTILEDIRPRLLASAGDEVR